MPAMETGHSVSSWTVASERVQGDRERSSYTSGGLLETLLHSNDLHILILAH